MNIAEQLNEVAKTNQKYIDENTEYAVNIPVKDRMEYLKKTAKKSWVVFERRNNQGKRYGQSKMYLASTQQLTEVTPYKNDQKKWRFHILQR